MAFTGTATITKVTESKFRITGVKLLGTDAGTISLRAGAGAVKLDAAEWGQYRSSGQQGGAVDLSEAVQCVVIPADSTIAPLLGSQSPAIVKTGTTPSDFLITVSGRRGVTDDSGNLEIYVQFG